MLSAVLKAFSFILAAIVGGLVVSWLSPHQPPVAVQTRTESTSGFLPNSLVTTVTQMPAAERVRLGGYVEPRNSVRLTAQAPGRVVYVAGAEGDRLSAGQLVVALDDDMLQAQYRGAWASLSGEMANSQNAQTQLYQKLYGPRTSPMGGPLYDAYDRASVPLYNMAQSFMGGLFGNSLPMQTQQQGQRDWSVLNNARADYEGRMAALAGAQAQVDVLDAQFRDRRSLAPFASAIINRHVRVGDIVQPGQPLMDLSDADQLDLRIEVPLSALPALKLGDQIPITLDNVNLWAPVSQIFPAATEGQHTVTVKLALPAGAPAAPGMYALAWVAQPGGGSPSALAPAIPASAIVRRGSLPVAFVVDRRGVAEMRVLRLGETQGSGTAVLSGLEAGELVVTQPSSTLKSGDYLTGGQP